ncbi:hypothetical protein TELCIR_05043 [Teladorsagia circumcincta]|uniref:Peptidase M12A domain-containing protein n=1 Tax=Teladorsagia circumcincta TaxID=45464 RepID=A0A2G9URX0_TELCI|nr:hypothetical protein TELCIR_05043 [Teladorsagia circumcincta]
MYYNCNDACKEAPTRCHDDGFPHPRNCSKCICPSGYGGQLCNEGPRGCGDVLRATKRWKSLEGEMCRSEISTDGFMRCDYWIELPGFEDDGCVSVGVEIKTHPDQRRTGYRFCSSAYVNKTLTSALSKVPVIFYKKYESKPHIAREDPVHDYEDGGGFLEMMKTEEKRKNKFPLG